MPAYMIRKKRGDRKAGDDVLPKHNYNIPLKNPEILNFTSLPPGKRMQFSYDVGTGEIYPDMVSVNTRVLYDDPFVVYVTTTGKNVKEEEFKTLVTEAIMRKRGE